MKGKRIEKSKIFFLKSVDFHIKVMYYNNGKRKTNKESRGKLL